MSAYLQDADVTLYHGDVLAVLRDLPASSVDCVVTSPPYWGLRDYGTGAWEGGDAECDHKLPATGGNPEQGPNKGNNNFEAMPFRERCGKCGATRIDQQLGLEPTPEQYVERMVEVFREVRRVLAAHGTCWLNLGDSYATGQASDSRSSEERSSKSTLGPKRDGLGGSNAAHVARSFEPRKLQAGLKPKDLVGIPWRVAFALQADGWYLRSDIIWSKPNPMPESVTDRPTKAHEYVFLLSKNPRYFFDQEAVREAAAWERWGDQTNGKHEGQASAAGWIGSATKEELQRRATKTKKPDGWDTGPGGHGTVHRDGREKGAENYVEARGRNIRSVWEIATQPYPEAHFATFPEELARRAIAAGCPEQVCRVCGKPAGAEIVRTPLGNGSSFDPTPLTGRKGMNRIRRDDEGTRGITKAEQRDYAQQLRESPWREQMATEAGEAFAHYIRTDDSGARPVPPNFLNEWIDRGWLTAAEASDCGHADYRPGIVLDPFMGSGTVAYVARKLGRHSIGIDLSVEYLALAARRLQQQSLLTEIVA